MLVPRSLAAALAFVSCLLSFAPPAAAQCDPPKITSQPFHATVCAGSPASFSVTAGGTAPLSYQWQKNGVDILGATSSTYSIAVVTVAHAGSYGVVVRNSCGLRTSAPATPHHRRPARWA